MLYKRPGLQMRNGDRTWVVLDGQLKKDGKWVGDLSGQVKGKGKCLWKWKEGAWEKCKCRCWWSLAVIWKSSVQFQSISCLHYWLNPIFPVLPYTSFLVLPSQLTCRVCNFMNMWASFFMFTLTLFLRLKCPCPTYQILLSLEQKNRILIRKGNVFLFPSFASKATFCILPSWPEIRCSLSWLLVFTLVSTKL